MSARKGQPSLLASPSSRTGSNKGSPPASLPHTPDIAQKVLSHHNEGTSSILLDVKIFDKSLDIPFIPPQLIEKLLGPFIRKELIEIIILPGKEDIEIHLSLFLFFGIPLRESIVFSFH
jgi:hypothetical protein